MNFKSFVSSILLMLIECAKPLYMFLGLFISPSKKNGFLHIFEFLIDESLNFGVKDFIGK